MATEGGSGATDWVPKRKMFVESLNDLRVGPNGLTLCYTRMIVVVSNLVSVRILTPGLSKLRSIVIGLCIIVYLCS